MNKKVVLLASGVLGAIGAYIPLLFGDNNVLSGWSILGGFVGGLIGIWVGVVIARNME